MSNGTRVTGSVILGIGLTLAATLMLTGVAGLSRDEPDMGDLHQVVATYAVGPVAVGLIAWGFVLRRRNRGQTQR